MIGEMIPTDDERYLICDNKECAYKYHLPSFSDSQTLKPYTDCPKCSKSK